MESEAQIILEELLLRCFLDERKRSDVRDRLEEAGINSSNDLDYASEKQML